MTNACDSVAQNAADFGTQAAQAFQHEFSRGQEFIEQAWAWMLERGVDFAANVVMAALILVLGGFVVCAVKAFVRRTLRKTGRVSPLLEQFLCSIVSKTGWIVLIVLALGRLGVNVGPLVAGLGITGFVFGFALKDTLANFASGVMIAVNQPFKVGDYVIAGGKEGTVKEVNMMATVLVAKEGERIVIPNNAVWGGPVTNFGAKKA